MSICNILKTHKRVVFFLFIIVFLFSSNILSSEKYDWYEKDINHKAVINLYFFWSENCPHCLNALPDIIEIDKEFPWLKLHSFELSKYPENINIFESMASGFGNDARSVPTFMFCGNLISGYENKQTTGIWLRTTLIDCYQFAKVNNPNNSVAFPLNKSESVYIPFLGSISSADYSLPVLTILIAGMDAFNPCAFFVLLFLMSIMVHGKSRKRMALIGGLFVFVSGVMYFIFMAAWLNLFIYLGELRLITIIAGTIAVLIASINIKDYFWFKKGISLTIPASKKPALFERIRSLLRFDSIISVVVATIIFAIVANSYELLCTAGFPMIYTRILTLNVLSMQSYYLYLLLYNLIYVLPLFAIVVLFSIKLGARKMTEHEGMILKLLSGVMMLLLGSLLVLSHQLLNNILVAATLLLASIGVTWLIVKFSKSKKSNKL